MHKLDINGDRFRDKVLGCWIGKNCGGTLGTPIEEAWGRADPFDIWWYPELQSGGLPNDDLEMQLVWLTALEQVGPGLTARDLARYWLDHIGYNWDEYGLSKANLRLGLEPPVSGAFNNWFIDCMGSPIRSEVWACVAPGHPRIAALYAYEDSICDHAGGESVFGELFNVAIQSAAFIVEDRQTLLDIGLSYVPDGSATQRAVLTARTAHAEGLTWQEARERVLQATPSLIAQYSPINMGFQVIGWLYGEDFGDALCKTVNCGYDTDSSGGSIGSWLGITAGIAQLPTKWIEPFGMGLSTNESWGGVRHLTDGSTPIPTDIEELTDMVVRQAERVLRHHGCELDGGTVMVEEADLYADDTVRALWSRSAWEVKHPGIHLDVAIDYAGSAAAAAGEAKPLRVSVTNPHPDPVTVDLWVTVPAGWTRVPDQQVELDAHGSAELAVTVQPGTRSTIEQRNLVLAHAQPRAYPYTAPVPVPLVGASAWRVTEIAGGSDLSALPERSGPGESWREIAVEGNAVPLTELVTGAGTTTALQTWVETPEPTDVRLGVDCSIGTQVFVNGRLLMSSSGPRLVRPSYGVSEDVNRVVPLRAGFNEVVILVDGDVSEGPELYVYLSTPDELRHGIVHLGRTRFPWDQL
jgi:ADP-ribosylglycohydrolase